MRYLMASLTVGLLVACSGDGASDTTIPDASSGSTSSVTESAESAEPSTTVVSTTATPTTIASAQDLVVTLVSEPASSSPVSAVADEEGRPVVAHVSVAGDLVVLRCSDPDCSGSVVQAVLGHPGEALDLDLALLPDGSPVVVVGLFDDATFDEFTMVFICSDPACSSPEAAEVGTSVQAAYPSIEVGSDGLPRIIYFTETDPMELVLAVCQDRICSQQESVTIDTLPPQAWTGAPSLRIDALDRVIVGYWYSQGEESQQSRIAVCEDASCDSPPTILNIDGGVFAQTTPGTTDAEFLVWYRTGSEGLPGELITDEAMAEGASAFPAIWSEYSDFMVAACTTAGCADFRHIEVGEDWVLPSGVAFRLFADPDGSTGAFFFHASRAEPIAQLHVTICADLTCTEGTTQALGFEDILGSPFDVITSPNTPPRLVFTSETGVHLYRCPNESCSASP